MTKVNATLTKPAVLDTTLLGIGLRFLHHRDIVNQKPDIGWIEVHPENYFSGGEARLHLEQVRQIYPVSFHAVGMSLGSVERVNKDYLKELKTLAEQYSPFQISDHASWSMSGNAHLNDLMPLPYNEESLSVLCRNIDEVQHFLGREIAIENPSSYVAFSINTMTEYEFLNEACKRTGCQLLLDINNVYVQSHNHNFNPDSYINNLTADFISEIHLAGHTEKYYDDSPGSLLIDTHSKPVCDAVWRLYEYCVLKHGAISTLIEWDADIPSLEELVTEAHKAGEILNTCRNTLHAIA